MRRSVGEHLGAWEPPSMGRSAGPAESETERLGSILRTGQYGSGVSAIDEYVEERVRYFLRRRHKVSTQGTRRFSMNQVYGILGVLRLQGPLSVAAS